MELKNLFINMSDMKRFSLIMFLLTFIFMFISSVIGITIGYFFSFGILIDYLLGSYFIGEFFLIFSPVLAFLFYLLYFDNDKDVLPMSKISKELLKTFKEHKPVIHIIDNDYNKLKKI